jgi:hypothetical protein
MPRGVHGPVKKTAGKPLTTNDDIQARVDELVSAPAAQAGVTIDRIMAELAKIGFSDVRRAAELSTGSMSASSPTRGRRAAPCG